MPSLPDDERHLRDAITAARAARAAGNMPFGAVLVRDGVALWTAQNNQITSGDCTGHAEVVLVREAVKALGADAVRGGTVYASGEPCAMCAGAMFWAGVSRIVYGAPAPAMGEILGDPTLPPRCAEVLAGARSAVEVVGPLLLDESLAVLQPGG